MLTPREQQEFLASLDPDERAAIRREYRNRIVGPLLATIGLAAANVVMLVSERRIRVTLVWLLVLAGGGLAWAVRGWWRYR